MSAKEHRGSDGICTARLVVREFTRALARAVMDGDRAAGSWAPGYPTDGDRVVAELLLSRPPMDDDHRRFGLYEVLLRSGSELLTIGGIGFFGPPVDGVVELGYGLAEEVRGQGLATEAVLAMVQVAAADPRVSVVRARVADDNPASRRVLEKAGFTYAGRDGTNPDEPLLVFHRPA